MKKIIALLLCVLFTVGISFTAFANDDSFWINGGDFKFGIRNRI